MTKRIQAFSLTDTGRTRKNNQDACAVFKKNENLLMVVADGVGGNRCGEVASRIAVKTMQQKFERAHDISPRTFLIEGTEEANQKVRAYVEAHPECKGMATTLVAALIQYPHLHLLHVGDSRGYLLRGGTLKRLTEDHTLVQGMVREGVLTPEEAKVHPKRHVIVNALGISDTQRYDYASYNLMPGDQILLCSDGLYDELSDESIGGILLGHAPKQAIQRLVNAANAAGGRDNISITLAVLEPASLEDTRRLGPAGKSLATPHPFAKWLVIALCTGVFLAGAWAFFQTPRGHKARLYISSLLGREGTGRQAAESAHRQNP